MAQLIEVAFERATDSNGNPISGAKRKVFDAGTSNLSTVYTDAAGLVPGANPIISDSAGIFPNRYLADGTYDIQYLDAADVPLGPTKEDFVVSASSGGGGGGGGQIYDVVVKTSNYAVQAADVDGKIPVLLVDASGVPGLEAIITISAATLLADAGVIVINTAATGTVRVQPGGGETIDGGADVTLVGLGKGQGFVCIGAAGWQTISSTTVGLPAGGSKGQALKKTTATNYDAAWAPSREVLSANRTYYVRTDGNDSNDGLANTTGGAFLTIQKAVDVASGLDFNGFTVTIQVGNGTYTATVTIPPSMKDADKFIIQGDTGTPGNVIISVTSGDCFTASDGAQATIRGFEIRTTTSGSGLVATRGAIIKYGAMNFGAVAVAHLLSSFGATLKAVSNYTINGNANRHFSAPQAGRIDASGLAITLSGSRTFTVWAGASENGYINVNGTTYTGSATGNRGTATLGGGIDTAATTQPGSTGPTTTSPGWAT